MKNKIENERIVLWKDEGQITAMRQQLETLLPLAERIAAIYHEMPFADPKVTYYDLYSNTESKADAYIRKLAANAPAPEGLAIDANKYAQFLKLEGMDAFIEAKADFVASGGDRSVSYFRMKGQAVEIDPIQFEKFASQLTIAVEEESKELYKLWRNMIAGLVEFNEYVKRDFTFLAGLSCPKLPVFLKENRDGKIVPNHEMFRTVAKQLQKHTS